MDDNVVAEAHRCKCSPPPKSRSFVVGLAVCPKCQKFQEPQGEPV